MKDSWDPEEFQPITFSYLYIFWTSWTIIPNQKISYMGKTLHFTRKEEYKRLDYLSTSYFEPYLLPAPIKIKYPTLTLYIFGNKVGGGNSSRWCWITTSNFLPKKKQQKQNWFPLWWLTIKSGLYIDPCDLQRQKFHILN